MGYPEMKKILSALVLFFLITTTASAQHLAAFRIGLGGDNFDYTERFKNANGNDAWLTGNNWVAPTVSGAFHYIPDSSWAVPIHLMAEAEYPLDRIAGYEIGYFNTNNTTYQNQREDVYHSLQYVQGRLGFEFSPYFTLFGFVERSLFQSLRKNLRKAEDSTSLVPQPDAPWNEYVYSSHVGGGAFGLLLKNPAQLEEASVWYEVSYGSPIAVFVSNSADDAAGHVGAFAHSAVGYELGGKIWVLYGLTNSTNARFEINTLYNYWSGGREQQGSITRLWPSNTMVRYGINLSLEFKLS